MGDLLIDTGSLLHVIYPLTLNTEGQPYFTGLVIDQLLYFLMFLAGIWVASDSRFNLIITVSTAPLI